MLFKSDYSDILMELGKSVEKDLDKMFCILLNIREKLCQEVNVNPTYELKMALECLLSIMDSYRSHNRKGRDLFDWLSGWMRRMDWELLSDPAEESDKEYPMDPMYHMAVAEQERELYNLYPSRYGKE